MAEITMPKLSDTMTEGTLVKWKKKVGDKVESGEVIAEVETDKATMEMESFEEGTLTEILIQEGEKVEIGQVIARVGEANGAAPAAKEKPAEKPAAKKDEKRPAAPAEVPPDAKPEERVPQGEEPRNAEKPEARGTAPAKPEAAPASPAQDGGRAKASPLAKKLAKERGVDLAQVQGSGPGGRIVQKDVLAATGGTAPKAAPPPASAPAPMTTPTAPAAAPEKAAPVPAVEGTRRVPLSGMRRAIATRLLESKTRIPHFYLHIEVDAAPLMKLRADLNKMGEAEGVKYSVNDLLLKAVVASLARHPKVNASFDNDAIVEHEGIHLSVAVAVEEGLVTPVIRDARRRTLGEISAAVKDLATRARSKKLKPEEYQGGTFTVSNLGAYGIDQFDAIINPPQAAILSVGRVVKKPVVNDAGEIVAGERLNLGLSCDHRVVDGAIGADFLATLRKLVENPLAMLAG